MKHDKLIITSGYFNPLHKGHVEYLEKSKSLGDYLIVIVNTDEQVKLKGSVPFMKEDDRLEIVGALRYVDFAILSIDKDKSVCETIKKIHKCFQDDDCEIIFAKGGDRFAKEIPEAKVCKELGINMVDGLGNKIRSSSELIAASSK